MTINCNVTDAKAPSQIDEQTRQFISQINPGTPSQRLVQIFGSPIFSGKNENSHGMTLDIYQYKYQAWAFDYHSGARRVALVLATKDPWLGESMLFDQIRGVDIRQVYTDCNGVKATAHYNAASRICPPSHATNYVEKVYFFNSVFSTQLKPEASAKACQANESVLPDPSKCPGFGSVPALAVALASDPGFNKSVDADLSRVTDAYLDELDFGNTISWLSPDEGKAYDKLIDAENNMTAEQLDAVNLEYVQNRASRYSELLR